MANAPRTGRRTTKAAASGARLRPLPMDRMRAGWRLTLARIPGGGLKGALAPVNVLGTLAHSPRTMGAFLRYWVRCKTDSAFTVREQEIVILRMGYRFGSDYVWKHHVPVAREFGVADTELAALRLPAAGRALGERERMLVALTDELVERRTLRDGTWARYGERLSATEWIDLIGLVSQYTYFALVNNAMRVEIEEPLRAVPGLRSRSVR